MALSACSLSEADKARITRLCKANDETWLTTHSIISSPMENGACAHVLWSGDAGFLLFKTQKFPEWAFHKEPTGFEYADRVEVYFVLVDKKRRNEGILKGLVTRFCAMTDGLGLTAWLVVAESPNDTFSWGVGELVEMWQRCGFCLQSSLSSREIVMTRPALAVLCRPRRATANY
jgi:hypothetical protein